MFKVTSPFLKTQLSSSPPYHWKITMDIFATKEFDLHILQIIKKVKRARKVLLTHGDTLNT
jgi:hypothetical protein